MAELIERGWAEDAADAETYLAVQQEAMEVSAQASMRYAEEFAGTWIDPLTRELNLAFAGSEAAARVADLQEGTSVELVPHDVEYSLEDLNEIHIRLVDRMRADGATYGVRTDVLANRVTLHANNAETVDSSLSDRSSYRRAMSSMDRQAIALSDQPLPVGHDDACNSQIVCDPPLRGGVKMQPVCSGGFVMTLAGTEDFHIATAGHCYDSGDYVSQKVTTSSSNITIGPVPTAGSVTGGFVDGAIVHVDSTTYWSPSRWVRHNLSAQALAITHKPFSFISIPVGLVVCRTGGVSVAQCGPIISLASSAVGEILQLEADMCASPGDSGGPWYVRSTQDDIPLGTAIGLHNGSDDGSSCTSTEHSYASHINLVEAALGVQVWCGGGFDNGCTFVL